MHFRVIVAPEWPVSTMIFEPESIFGPTGDTGSFFVFSWNYTEIEIYVRALCKGFILIFYFLLLININSCFFFWVYTQKFVCLLFFCFVYECDWKRTHVKRFKFVCKNSAYIHWLSNENARKLRWTHYANKICGSAIKGKMFYTFHSLTCVFISFQRKKKKKLTKKKSAYKLECILNEFKLSESESSLNESIEINS